jgi:hypothetical protein
LLLTAIIAGRRAMLPLASFAELFDMAPKPPSSTSARPRDRTRREILLAHASRTSALASKHVVTDIISEGDDDDGDDEDEDMPLKMASATLTRFFDDMQAMQESHRQAIEHSLVTATDRLKRELRTEMKTLVRNAVRDELEVTVPGTSEAIFLDSGNGPSSQPASSAAPATGSIQAMQSQLDDVITTLENGFALVQDDYFRISGKAIAHHAEGTRSVDTISAGGGDSHGTAFDGPCRPNGKVHCMGEGHRGFGAIGRWSLF